jgi:uncharacterized protein YjiS (DUF1127 family)
LDFASKRRGLTPVPSRNRADFGMEPSSRSTHLCRHRRDRNKGTRCNYKPYLILAALQCGRRTEPFLGDSARQVIGRLRRWRERMRSRRQLRMLCDLDDHILQDIGLTRSELLGGAEKPFWR